MQTARASQVKPMTVWCLAAIVLVASVLAIAVTLFYMPGSKQSLEKQTPAAVSH
jgi:CHASE2 domain-containing sensor protein